jgi:hypothetical protein
MKRKYRAQAYVYGSSCSTCERKFCARESRKHLCVVIYCRNYQRRAEEGTP